VIEREYMLSVSRQPITNPIDPFNPITVDTCNLTNSKVEAQKSTKLGLAPTTSSLHFMIF
jgi:hypothetical protein